MRTLAQIVAAGLVAMIAGALVALAVMWLGGLL